MRGPWATPATRTQGATSGVARRARCAARAPRHRLGGADRSLAAAVVGCRSGLRQRAAPPRRPRRADQRAHARRDQCPHRAAGLRRRRCDQGRRRRGVQVHHQRRQHRHHRQRTPAAGPGCSAGDPGYPGSCDWPSIKEVPRAEPDLHPRRPGRLDRRKLDLPDGRYLISVLADGYKIDGAHFTMPLPSAGARSTVELQPNPLPDSTLRAQVFADIAPTNGTLDAGDARPGRLRRATSPTTSARSAPTSTATRCARRTTARTPSPTRSPSADLDADMLPVVDDDRRQLRQRRRRPPDHPAPRHQPLRALRHPAGRPDLDPDHHPRGQPRLGRLGDGGHAPATTPSSCSPASRCRSRSSGSRRRSRTGSRSTRRPPATSPAPWSASRPTRPPKGGSFDFWGGNTGTKIERPHRPALALARRPADTATRPSGSAAATPTAPSTSPASRTATTR